MRNKFYLSIVAFIVIGLLAACAPVSAAPLGNSAANSTDPSASLRTMMVTGTGTIYLVPDLAYINIGVHSENDNVADALSSNTAQAQQVSDVLTNQGIDPKDIQTSSFNIYPQQKYNPTTGEATGTTYVVDNTVFVTIRDISKLGGILSAVVGSGANNINGISFDSTAKDQAIQEARSAAISDAQQQAQALADAAGVGLDAIQSISVSGTSPSPIYYGTGMKDAALASVPVSAGQLAIQMTANLTYSLK